MDLRNRLYTYDSNGDIVLVSQIDPDKLPSQRYKMGRDLPTYCRINVKVAVKDDGGDPAPPLTQVTPMKPVSAKYKPTLPKIPIVNNVTSDTITTDSHS